MEEAAGSKKKPDRCDITVKSMDRPQARKGLRYWTLFRETLAEAAAVRKELTGAGAGNAQLLEASAAGDHCRDGCALPALRILVVYTVHD